MRCFASAIEAGKVTAEVPFYHCGRCQKQTIYPVCEDCGSRTAKNALLQKLRKRDV